LLRSGQALRSLAMTEYDIVVPPTLNFSGM
jgi:hypothetical protein